jgi:hypothetical protein
LRELIPGFPDRAHSMDDLVNTVRVLSTDPRSVFPYLPRLLLNQVHDKLLEFSENVQSDRQFRTAPQTSEPWRFSFPLLTHEYLRICSLDSRWL